MVLLTISTAVYAEAAGPLPEDGFLEFLGEFNSYDDDTLAIAMEAPLDASEQQRTRQSDSGQDTPHSEDSKQPDGEE